jgi:hypothetical protein
MMPAMATETVIPPWIDGATDSNFSGSGALWVSTGASWPGGSGNTEGSASGDQWRLFEDSFTLPAGAEVSAAHIAYTGDNAVALYLNGTQIDTTNTTATDYVFGPTATDTPAVFSEVSEKHMTLGAATNTLNFVVRNMGGDYSSNPTGLIYHAAITYCMPEDEDEDEDDEGVTVTIHKYIDGVKATTGTAQGAAFPMSASWNATNTGAGTGAYTLNASGYGDDPTPYKAKTTVMTDGASYSTNEVVGGVVVGASCSTGQPFALVGYSTGKNLHMAELASTTATAPILTNLTHNAVIIVKNMTCDEDGTTTSSSTGSIGGDVSGGTSMDGSLIVTSIDMIQTAATADNTFANGWKYVFHITAPISEPKLAMKFSDWMNIPNPSLLAVANNMRISSLQANNAGATILLTAANTYSSPDLTMVTDLDLGTPGRQVEVVVEVKIPASTVNGAYTTTYGVRTLN